MSKETGDNAHGFKNEKNIVFDLEGKRYKDLNLNLKRFVSYIAKCEGKNISNETKIDSRIETDNRKKQDLYVSIDEDEYAVSVKMGGGNSAHQEKCEDFIKYIVEKFGASKELCDDIRVMLWCDGTLDGKGTGKRMTTKEYLETHKDEIEKIREFLDKHTKELIQRALFIGKYNSKVDYIYHGTPMSGKWISAKELIEYQVNNKKKLQKGSLARLGRMNVQVWNRCLNGKESKRRGQIQIKYTSLENDLQNIMHSHEENIGTFEGDQEEFNISRIMNRNKKSSLWDIIGHKNNNDDMYVVKVMYNAYSKIAKKKVKTKTDAYVISKKLDEKFLLEREYILTEDDIKGKEYIIVEETGISVKKNDSKKYTYEKLSYNSFIELFDKYLDNARMIFCGLTLYQEEKNINLNKQIIEDCNFVEKEFLEMMESKIGTLTASIYKKEDVKAFREYCEKILRNVIENNNEVKEMIFTGKGCFESPYYVNYIYKEGSLSDKVIPEKYQITNGSGRSKRKYTIIFKPM